MLLYQILASAVHGEKIETLYKKKKNLKYQLPREKIILNYLMDHILHQILKIILRISLNMMKQYLRIPQIRIYVNNIQNRITFRIQTGHYLEFLTFEAMTLLRITKIKYLKQFYEVFSSIGLFLTMLANMIQQSCTYLF